MSEIKWIPFKFHELTEQEKQEDERLADYDICLDCDMPTDGEEIIITTKDGYVMADTCTICGGYYLESGLDWTEDVLAWAEMPERYEG